MEFFKEFEEILIDLLSEQELSDLALNVLKWFLTHSPDVLQFFTHYSKTNLLSTNCIENRREFIFGLRSAKYSLSVGRVIKRLSVGALQGPQHSELQRQLLGLAEVFGF